MQATKLDTKRKEWNYWRGDSNWELSVTDSLDTKENKQRFTKPKTKIFRATYMLADLISINSINIGLLYLLPQSNHYLLLSLVSNVAWLVAAYASALYWGNQRFASRTAKAFLFYSSLILLFLFANKYTYSRLFVLLSFLFFAASLAITRTIAMTTYYYLQKQGQLTKKVVILGYNNLSTRLSATFRNSSLYTIDGYFDDDTNFTGFSPYNISSPILGSLSDSLDYSIKNGVHEIYSTISPEQNPEIYEIAHEAERNFIRFKYVPDFSGFINRRVHIGFAGDMPVLSLRTEPLEEASNNIKKRVFDVIFSLLVIVCVLSWLLPIIALLIKLDSRGPVFFKQWRSGKSNEPFLCFKFRSLKVNPEADKKQVTQNDSRLTKFGKFLRKSNLDELPQFFNVLKGSMSVVGPRPHMLKHTEEYSALMNQYMVRHFVKPGVSGWAQINGFRGEIKKKEQLQKRIEYDIDYLENWTMWFDLKIIFLTVYKTLVGDKNAF